MLSMKRDKHRKDIIAEKRYGGKDESAVKEGDEEEQKENEDVTHKTLEIM